MVRLKKKPVLLFLFVCLLRLSFMHGEASEAAQNYHIIHHERLRALGAIKASVLAGRGSILSPSPAPAGSPPQVNFWVLSKFYDHVFGLLVALALKLGGHGVLVQASPRTRVFKVTDYGADPTGQTDSTEAIFRAISDAFRAFDNKVLMAGIADLGGAEVHLEGGTYNISNPLRLPASGGGNVVV